MLIKVIKIFIRNEKKFIQFTSDIGSAIGEWIYESEPIENYYYLAEVNIPGNLIWGLDLVPCENVNENIIMNQENEILIHGKLISYELVNHFIIKILDTEIICYIDGISHPIKEYVEAKAKYLEIWPHLDVGFEPNITETTI